MVLHTHFAFLVAGPFAYLSQTSLASSSTDYSDTATGMPFLTPSPMTGLCNASCTPNESPHPKFPCVYTPYYPVIFYPNGYFSWTAPYANGSGAERGQGQILSEVTETRYRNGSWKARWFGGNRYKPDPQQVTHCACYYLTGDLHGGTGTRTTADGHVGIITSKTKGPFEVHNYPVAEAKFTAGTQTIEEACQKYYTHCPEKVEEALRKFGPPWLETYVGCEDIVPIGKKEQKDAMQIHGNEQIEEEQNTKNVLLAKQPPIKGSEVARTPA